MQRRTLSTTGLARAAAAMLGPPGQAAAQETIKIGLIAPMSGNYARPGQVMKMGAELGIEDINAQGGIAALGGAKLELVVRSEEHTSELQSLMRISYAVFCLKKKKKRKCE